MEIERYFLFANIDRYWPVKRFGKWREDASVRELFCLPNEQSVADFEGPVRDALDKLKAKANEPKFEKYRPYIDPLDRKLRDTAAGSAPLASLATFLDRLLCDQINDGDPSEPILREFWAQPELSDLRPEFQRLRDAVKFGDPLYLVKEFGRGRVAVFTTDTGGVHPGGTWTDWPAGTGAPAWLAVMNELHKFLSGGPAEENRSVGSAIDEPLDPARYRPTVARQFLTCDPLKADRGGDLAVEPTKAETDTLAANGGVLPFRFNKATTPGVFLFTFTALTPPPVAWNPAGHATAFPANPPAGASPISAITVRVPPRYRASACSLLRTVPGLRSFACNEPSFTLALVTALRFSCRVPTEPLPRPAAKAVAPPSSRK